MINSITNRRIYALVTALAITAGSLTVAGSSLGKEKVSAEEATGAVVQTVTGVTVNDNIITEAGVVKEIKDGAIIIEINGVDEIFRYVGDYIEVGDKVEVVYDSDTKNIINLYRIKGTESAVTTTVAVTDVDNNAITEAGVVKEINEETIVIEIDGVDKTFNCAGYEDIIKVGDKVEISYDEESGLVYTIGVKQETTEPEVTTVTTSDAENELPVTTNEDGIYRADVLVRDVKKVEDGVFEVTAKMYGKDNVKFTCTDASIEEMFTGEYFIANIEGNYDDKTITSIEKTAAYEVSEKEGYVVKVTAEDGGFGIALGENMETEQLQYVFVPEDTFNELGITVGTKVSVSLSNYYSSLEAIEVLEQPETTTTTETEPTETTTEDTEITTTETTTTTAIFTETQPTETSNTEVTKPSDIVEVADVNGDGKVNIIDLMQIAQYIVGVEGASGADVNGDGKANILDLMLVAQYIVGADADSTTTTTTTTTTFATTESETLPAIETIPTTQISYEPEETTTTSITEETTAQVSYEPTEEDTTTIE